MRARRREINIFNMSLLDILCGALGAFCFMMLVALPYYIPPGSGLELRKAQAETDRLLLAIGNLKDRMPDQKSVEEMEELMRQLEAQVKALQGRVNILTAEKEEMQGRMNLLAAEKNKLQAQVNQLAAEKAQFQAQLDQLAAEKAQLEEANRQVTAKNESLTAMNDNLTAANKEWAKRFNQRKPFLVTANADVLSQTIELLMTEQTKDEKASEATKGKLKQWNKGTLPLGFINFFLSGRGSATEIRTEVSTGTRYNVYLRLANGSDARVKTDINSALLEPTEKNPPTRLPKVTLTPERFWALSGTLTIDENYRPIFRESTAEERDAEWTTVTEETPPPMPTPTPPPSAEEQAAAQAARARRQAARLKFGRLMDLSQAPAESKEAEILSLSEEMLNELPKGDGMRRQVESIREHTLALKARRERAQSPAPPTGSTPPPAPTRPQLSPPPSLSPPP